MSKNYNKILIIALSFLVVINMSAVCISLMYNSNKFNNNSVNIPQDIIDKEEDHLDESPNNNESSNDNLVIDEIDKEAEVIEINKNNTVDNKSFNVLNMLPGDHETEYYCIRVSYKDNITLKYNAKIKEDYDNLSDVLKIKVKLMNTNEILYDGLLKDMPDSINSNFFSTKSVTEDFYYEITTYLDTSVGNLYQNNKLVVDFEWRVDDNNLENPSTGDNIIFWVYGSGISGLLIVLLLLNLKDKRKDNYE